MGTTTERYYAKKRLKQDQKKRRQEQEKRLKERENNGKNE